MGKYDYLKQYVDLEFKYSRNRFQSCTESEIVDAEKKIGFKFPTALKEFWLEIGGGIRGFARNLVGVKSV